MATIKTTYIQHPSSPDPNIELAADGTVVLPLSDLEDLANVEGTPANGQVLMFNSSSGKWEAKDLVLKEKRIARFTGNGTWTVPAGVTYAIAHMIGGGGGCGRFNSAGNGAASSVAFASGTVSAPGMPKAMTGFATPNIAQAGFANSGASATLGATGDNPEYSGGHVSQYVVAGAAVTPAASISVTVGAGGSAGTGGAAGGSGYVYIEYYQ